MRRMGERAHVLIEVEARDHGRGACHVNAPRQILVGGVEPPVQHRHANAVPSRAEIPRLRRVDGLGRPLDAEQDLVVADAGGAGA
jgi:hypothetical protein